MASQSHILFYKENEYQIKIVNLLEGTMKVLDLNGEVEGVFCSKKGTLSFIIDKSKTLFILDHTQSTNQIILEKIPL